MEWRLGLIGLSRSSHGQAFWGFGSNALRKNFWPDFAAHCESSVQDIENIALVIKVFDCSFLREKKNCTTVLCIFP